MASVPKRSILGRKCVLKIFGYPYFNGNVKNINVQSINTIYVKDVVYLKVSIGFFYLLL